MRFCQYEPEKSEPTVALYLREYKNGSVELWGMDKGGSSLLMTFRFGKYELHYRGFILEGVEYDSQGCIKKKE